MILVDFREWSFKNSSRLLNAQKVLLEKDFDTLQNIEVFDIVNLGHTSLKLGDLFFEKGRVVGISAVKSISNYYESIDAVMESLDVEMIDYTEAAEESVYFYGGSSLVAHKQKEIGLCGVNTSADESVFEEYCEDFELTPLSFDLEDDLLTADMAFFAGDVLLICMELIADKKLKKHILKTCKTLGLQLVFLDEVQVRDGVLDMMMCKNAILLSTKAKALLKKQQLQVLENLGLVLKVVDVPFLEEVGVQLRDIML